MRFFPSCLLLLFIVQINYLTAQSFEKGAIILANFDTLTGFIQNHGYEELAYKVVFKNDRKSGVVTYRPEEIRAFVFKDGDYFESFDVSFDVRAGNGWQRVSGKRFLYLLEKGPIELYELNNKDQQPLFIRKNNGALQLLCDAKDGHPLYHDVLAKAFSDCVLINTPDRIDLTVASIRPLVEDYNNCETLRKNMELPFVQAWVFVGVAASAVFHDFNGFNKGISLEFRPFHSGILSHWNLGMEGQALDYENERAKDDVSHFKIREIAAKARFFFPIRSNIVKPYGFIGAMHRWYEREITFIDPADGSRFYDEQIWEESTMQVGMGLHASVRRHLFRVEMSLDKEVGVRVGYGLVLW